VGIAGRRTYQDVAVVEATRQLQERLGLLLPRNPSQGADGATIHTSVKPEGRPH
jgi:hypothetical protein